MNIVWFKRDLRVQDHKPLCMALGNGPTVGLFLVEPAWLESEEFSWDHLRFVLESLAELQQDLSRLGIPLLIRSGEAREVLEQLHHHHPIRGIYSHEETGLDWSYRRDLAVKAWCQEQGVPWSEARQFGVIRGLKDRDKWAAKRSVLIERPVYETAGQSEIRCPWELGSLPWDLLQGKPLKALAQKGGRQVSQTLLSSFLSSRGAEYTQQMSSPLTAFDACSRLSPYIAWGQISMTEIYHALQRRRQTLAEELPEKRRLWQQSLRSFESRLWWHCHFIQKLESEPSIEFENFNREFDGMREAEWDEARFQAWCRGETGFPMIDACMRALLQHGWINFRMRAMLMSFASYQLWLHWKKPAIHLAKHFLDFEPGIHYSQAQMQSGITGINTIRIYSPRKQQLDQDPHGEFVRRYVPELAPLNDVDIIDPHQMPDLLQLSLNVQLGRDYPLPIVDAEKSYQTAKQKIFSWKRRPSTRAASEKVLKKHGSRQSRHFPRQNRDLRALSGRALFEG